MEYYSAVSKYEIMNFQRITWILRVHHYTKTKTVPSALYGCQSTVHTCVRGRLGDDEGWGQHRTNTGGWELQRGQGGREMGLGEPQTAHSVPRCHHAI